MTNLSEYAKDQVIGSVVEFINQERVEELKKELVRILEEEKLAHVSQEKSLNEALAQVEKVRGFLGNPEKILGSDLTKHGEIAEQMEVHIRNARDLLDGKIPTATFEGVGRTAPEDYLIDGLMVQSKFINGINNNLNHVLSHMEKYPNFGRDGSFYQIPNDTYEIIKKIIDGNLPPLI